MPKKTEEQQAIRDGAIERANQHATRVPLDVLRKSVTALELADRIAGAGNPASVSDAGVAGAAALAAAEGAALNVRINLPSLTETKAADEIRAEMDSLSSQAAKLAARVRATVDEVLRSQQA